MRPAPSSYNCMTKIVIELNSCGIKSLLKNTGYSLDLKSSIWYWVMDLISIKKHNLFCAIKIWPSLERFNETLKQNITITEWEKLLGVIKVKVTPLIFLMIIMLIVQLDEDIIKCTFLLPICLWISLESLTVETWLTTTYEHKEIHNYQFLSEFWCHIFQEPLLGLIGTHTV